MASFDRLNLRDRAELIIGISNWCNYDCSYCMPHSKARTRRIDDTDALIKLIGESYDHFRAHAGTTYTGVMFVGGEPTIHAGFEHIIDSIQYIREKDENYRISVVTNLSRTIKWWKKIAPKITGILASYHQEFTNPEEFGGKIVELFETNPELIITVGLQPVPGGLRETHAHAKEIRRIVHSRIPHDVVATRFDFIVQHLYTGTDELMPYTPDELHEFISVMHDLNNPNINISDQMSSQDEFVTHSFTADGQYLGSECYAGVESITVAFDGRISRTARCLLSREKRILGNLTTGYTLPDKPIICDVPTGCGNCWFDYAVRKKRDDT